MTTKKSNKTITFEKAIVQFKKFVAKGSVRPLLKLVYFDGKFLTATNSHILLRVNVEYIEDLPSTEPFLYDVKKKCIVDQQLNYPDVSRLIPVYTDSQVILDDNINALLSHLKTAKKIVSKEYNRVITLSFHQSQTNIKAKNDNEEYRESLESVHVSGKDIKLNVSSAYMIHALEAVKSFGKLSSKPIVMCMNSPLRPININQENIFDVLVTPVRPY